eukprot:UN19609
MSAHNGMRLCSCVDLQANDIFVHPAHVSLDGYIKP